MEFVNLIIGLFTGFVDTTVGLVFSGIMVGGLLFLMWNLGTFLLVDGEHEKPQTKKKMIGAVIGLIAVVILKSAYVTLFFSEEGLINKVNDSTKVEYESSDAFNFIMKGEKLKTKDSATTVNDTINNTDSTSSGSTAQ